MKTLIGMREFVLLEFSKRNVYYYQDSKVLNKINNYANFLSRQPQLSDFVPCGEDGLPIEEPKHVSVSAATDEQWKQYCLDLKTYQQALDKVLFKGFYVAEYTDSPEYTKSICDEHNALHIAWYSKITCSWHLSKGIKSLESLTPYNLELTENANKIIGV